MLKPKRTVQTPKQNDYKEQRVSDCGWCAHKCKRYFELIKRGSDDSKIVCKNKEM
jgi:hypothetical protein